MDFKQWNGILCSVIIHFGFWFSFYFLWIYCIDNWEWKVQSLNAKIKNKTHTNPVHTILMMHLPFQILIIIFTGFRFESEWRMRNETQFQNKHHKHLMHFRPIHMSLYGTWEFCHYYDVNVIYFGLIWNQVIKITLWAAYFMLFYAILASIKHITLDLVCPVCSGGHFILWNKLFSHLTLVFRSCEWNIIYFVSNRRFQRNTWERWPEVFVGNMGSMKCYTHKKKWIHQTDLTYKFNILRSLKLDPLTCWIKFDMKRQK